MGVLSLEHDARRGANIQATPNPGRSRRAGTRPCLEVLSAEERHDAEKREAVASQPVDAQAAVVRLEPWGCAIEGIGGGGPHTIRIRTIVHDELALHEQASQLPF